MSKKLEDEAKICLEKLEELTQDILRNSTDGGDINFRQIVFTGLKQTKNQILLDKMKDLLFDKETNDLKKTIILGVFIHKEIFEPVIEYGENNVNVPYIDESYDDKESLLFILDALIELAYKNKIKNYETATPMLFQLYKIACSEKSSSKLADKLLQRFLNSKIGTVKSLQDEFAQIVKDKSSSVNEIVIAVDILARGLYKNSLDLVEFLLLRLVDENDNLINLLPIFDIATLSFGYFTDKKFENKIKKLFKIIDKIDIKSVNNTNETIIRIQNRINKYRNTFSIKS